METLIWPIIVKLSEGLRWSISTGPASVHTHMTWSAFLISVSLCRLKQDEYLLHPIILDQFRRGYLFGLLHRDRDYEEMHRLRNKEPKTWQKNTKNYLDAGKKWARRLNTYSVKLKRRHMHMLEDYLKNRDESDLLTQYKVRQVAEVPGSMGKLHYLFLLRKRQGKEEPLLIDIKEVYDEADNEWYNNPFEHHGIRMNEAGKLYAPGWEQRPGHATWKGNQYWGRQIPTQQVKLSNQLNELDQCDLCFSVASQLGSGHARGADKATRKVIQADFENRFDEYVAAAHQMLRELVAAVDDYRLESASIDEQTNRRLVGWS